MADSTNATTELARAVEMRSSNRAASVAHFEKAIALGTSEPHAFWMLAGILLEQGETQRGLEVCLRGLSSCSDNFELLFVHSIASLQLALYEPAAASCLKQLTLRPRDANIWTHLGMALRAIGNLRDSEDALRQACLLDANLAAAHFQLALTLLLGGDYAAGFEEYDWRWKLPATPQREFRQPSWDGGPLNGKRILIWPEQGAGDFIQFTRYLPVVAERGGRILLEVPGELKRLASWLAGDFELVEKGATARFDVQCSLLSLGGRCSSIPEPLQWPVPAELKGKWAERLGPKDKKRVALAWAGNPAHTEDRQRSISLEHFKAVCSVPSFEFFSVQMGAARQQIRQVEFGEQLRDLAPMLSDYAETAGALSQVDLVITVDTSVAHLAAALGLPTWILLQYAPDWRWGLKRADSVWYPSVRLFRQTRPNEWGATLEAIAGKLRNDG